MTTDGAGASGPGGDPIHIDPDNWLPRDLAGRCARCGTGPELEGFFRSVVFPELDMGYWISEMIRGIGPGEVTTFGAIARGLGDPAAARAVGALISEGVIEGPVHRVIFSDGRVPRGSMDPLSSEIGDPVLIKLERPVEFELSRPPLIVLSDIQKALAIRAERGTRNVNSVCGLDVSYGSINVCALSKFTLSGKHEGDMTTEVEPGLPYIPGYLFYREGPCMIEAVSKAREEGMIDGETLLMIDGNGMLHPRRMGIARQLGMVLDLPTCGASKRLMMGRVGEYRNAIKGISIAKVTDDEEVIGASIKAGEKKAFYLSAGHLTDLRTCIPLVSRMLSGRHPAPVKRAHDLANETRKRSLKNPIGLS
ncbi:MAG: endonuclease V [Candidatus Thermoplasmatota archaeon]|nr:endonuclease V [Candidatus Thermoplasmatota archaeon]